MWQKINSALPSLVDAVSDLTGYAAVRVPLERAGGANEVTLDLPGYGQLNTYGCGVVAGIMVLKFFRPDADFARFYSLVAPDPEEGTTTDELVRALRKSGLKVEDRFGLTFADLCQAIDQGRPVIIGIHNPGRPTGHRVTVYGYGRKPNLVFLAANGLPWFTSNRVPLRRFTRLWSPRGHGLICWLPRSPVRRRPRGRK